MALTMQALGCSSSFTSGAPLIGVRGSPPRASAVSPRSSLVLPGGDECYLSKVDYDDVASPWISPDFLDLRMRSSSLICNESVQALRKHFEGKDEGHAAPTANATASRQVVQERAAPSVKTSTLPVVVGFDEALFTQLYSPGSTYTTMSCFLDESFC